MIKEQETRLTLQEHDDDDYSRQNNPLGPVHGNTIYDWRTSVTHKLISSFAFPNVICRHLWIYVVSNCSKRYTQIILHMRTFRFKHSPYKSNIMIHMPAICHPFRLH
jgi:hypothetical protein